MLNVTELEGLVKEVRAMSEQGVAEIPYNHELCIAFRNEEIPGMDVLVEADYDRDTLAFGVETERGEEVIIEQEHNMNPDGFPEKGSTLTVIVTALETILDRVKESGALDEE